MYFFVSYQAHNGLLVVLAGTTTSDCVLMEHCEGKAQICQRSENAESLQPGDRQYYPLIQETEAPCNLKVTTSGL